MPTTVSDPGNIATADKAVMNPSHPKWGSPVEPPRVVVDPDSFKWTETFDFVVVGLGGAGVAAAVEAAERNVSVLAVDRYEGGGSSTANGGVFYAGGGTRIQREVGVEDTPEEMFKYLRLETQGVVADETLRRFCDTSAETVDWLLDHGAKLSSEGVCKYKINYPPLKYHLYNSDNSLVPAYAAQAKPAARGHRTAVSNKGKAWGLGFGIWEPLRDAAFKAGVRLDKYSEGRQLILDATGRVVGIKVLTIPAGSPEAAKFARYIRNADYLMMLIPPVLPIAAVAIGMAKRYLAAAARIEAEHREVRYIRALQGVLLSTGGFILNSTMVEYYAPRYSRGMPNGTLGDTGSGIRLGQSAGGALGAMGSVMGGCNINGPRAWSTGIVVNKLGERISHEGSYAATLGHAVVHSPEGVAYLIFDARIRKAAIKQIGFGAEIVKYQRQLAIFNLLFNIKKAATVEKLAARIGVPPEKLRATVEKHNRAARGEQLDAMGKVPAEMSVLDSGPFYAIDVSVHSRLFPLAVLTLGGLQVDEATGGVKHESGEVIQGLYAAGRTAVGICSNIYMSGLSYSDCVFSGRRAGRDVADRKQAQSEAMI